MPSARRSISTVVAAAFACAVLGALLVLLLSDSPTARAVGIGHLQQQISAGRNRVSSLAGQVNAASGRLAHLNGSIASLEAQIARIQADLNAKRAQLIKLQSQLAAARARLAQLEAFDAHAEQVLSQQLVSTYESDQPDLVSVVLESHGFQDLLERLTFAQKIQKQDVHIIHSVRVARREVAAQAIRLGALEVRQQTLVKQVLSERNALAATQTALLRQRLAVASSRDAKAGQLAQARGQVADLQRQLSQAESAQAAAAAPQQAPFSSGFSAPVSGGGFTFPLPKGSASPPGSWSEDQGVDIAAPGDTPEYAVCSGTIVLHGIGGFGPWAPVLHCDSSVGGYSYVYYGHAGPADQQPVGTHVGAGQVMSSIGPGIVGISTGPHLEIGFADASGSPIGGGSASTMMSLLQGSY